MNRKACPLCPFRIGSPTGFCPDGFAALDGVGEPSCHCIVGAGMQFIDPFPGEKKICIGYVSWINGDAGFAEPLRIQPNKTKRKQLLNKE